MSLYRFAARSPLVSKAPAFFNQRLISIGMERGPAHSFMGATFDDCHETLDPTIFEGVRKKVCFLFMSRSGSTFLVDKLNRTGRIGAIQEHMNAYRVKKGVENWGVTSMQGYVRKIVETTTSKNGVFAFKGSLDSLVPLAQIGEMPDHVRDWKFITIYRRDIVAQTISLTRAKATGVWHDRQGKGADAGFPDKVASMQELRRNYALIVRKQGAIERFMLMHGIEPLRLCYEDFCDDQTETMRSIFRFLKIREPRNLEKIARRERFNVMRKPETDEIAKRFVREF